MKSKHTFLVFTLIFSFIILSSLTITAEVPDKNNSLENLNLKIHKDVEGEISISLRQLAENYHWQLFYLPEAKRIKISGQGGELAFEIGDSEFAGRPLKLSPVIREGRTYIGPELTKLLLKELEEEKIPDLLSDISADRLKYKAGEEMRVVIKVYNLTDEKIELNFNSGKEYDLYLLKEDQELWRWSDDKFFTMVLKNKELEPGEEVTYRVNTLLPADLEEGSYLLGAEISTREIIKLEQIELLIISGK